MFSPDKLFDNAYRQFAVLLVSGMIVFGPALSGSWVWDDETIIASNPSVTAFKTDPVKYIKKIFTSDYFDSAAGPEFAREKRHGYYRPLAVLTYALVCSVAGNQPFYFHFLAFLFHLFATLLLIRIAAKITCLKTVSLVSGLIFFFHPVHHQAVCYATGIVDTQAAFFGLLSLLFLLEYLENPVGFRLLLSVILYAASIFTKETAFLMPLISMIPLFKNRKNFFILIIYALILAGFFIVRKYIIGFHVLDYSWPEYIIKYYGTICLIFFKSIFQVLVPSEYFYFKWFVPALSVYHSLLLFVIFIVFMSFIILKSDRVFSFGVLWFIVFYLPLSNIIPLAPQIRSMALFFPEHLLYLSSFGVCWIAACFFVTRSHGRLGLIFIMLLALQSFSISGVWNNEKNLCLFRLRQVPSSPEPYLELSAFYLGAGDYENAYRILDSGFTSLKRINPGSGLHLKMLNNMARAQIGLGKLSEAEQNLNVVLEYWPDNYISLFLLGEIYRFRGKPDLAASYYRKALQIQPEYTPAIISCNRLLSRK